MYVDCRGIGADILFSCEASYINFVPQNSHGQARAQIKSHLLFYPMAKRILFNLQEGEVTSLIIFLYWKVHSEK